MIAYVLRRLAEAAAVLFVIAVSVFFLSRALPGNPLRTGEKDLPKAVRESLERQYGLDLPASEQCARYFRSLLTRGDFGPSFKYKSATVNDLIGSGLPVSALLGFAALTIAILGGTALGVLSSVRRGSGWDYLSSIIAYAGVCIPGFVTGPVLVLVFAFGLGWFPVGGLDGPGSLVLPAVTLSLPYLATIARLTRAGLLENLPKDYIRTARAKGLPERTVVYKHALRNSIIPVVTYLGPAAADILTGSLVVEKVFALPGLGRHFVYSAINVDYWLILGTALVYSALLVGFNAVVDLSYGWIDPQIRHAAGGRAS